MDPDPMNPGLDDTCAALRQTETMLVDQLARARDAVRQLEDQLGLTRTLIQDLGCPPVTPPAPDDTP